MKLKLVAALLAGSAFCISAPAFAQEPPAGQEQPEPTEPDPSDAAADQAIAEAQGVDEAAAKIELLQSQVDALQDSIEQLKGNLVKATPTWKGMPQWDDKDEGWSFKPRGRIQYDVGYVSNPHDRVVTRNLGFNTRVRRLRLGAEGTIPGGFGYKFEMDYANAATGFGDVIITYQPKGQPYSFTIGNHETLNGLEQITSSRFTSFIERAAFDDAFINTRRIGANIGYVNSRGDLRFNAGLFAAHSIDGSLDNEGWIGAARAVYAPVWGGNQWHFGANFQHREFQSNNGGSTSASVGAPSGNRLARYRARPFSQLTDQRFVDTTNFAAKRDDIFGLEFATIFKSLHIAAEGQYLRANAYGRGDTFGVVGDTLNNFPGNLSTVLVPSGDPSFWGGYIEAGYFLTGETRGYKGGLWDRTKVLKPFSKGGWGAVQVNARADYLDLDSKRLRHGFLNNFLTGTSTVSNNEGRGGKQLGLLASVIWIPEDYFRMLFQYSHAFIEGGPLAGTVKPNDSSPLNERKYGVDVFMTRAQIDF